MWGESVDNVVESQLYALLLVICGLGEPGEGESDLPVKRPKELCGLDPRWPEKVVEAVAREVLFHFDVLLKTADDDPAKIEQWLQADAVDEEVEQRKNHRLRIRTAVDNLFEESLAHVDVPAYLRAYKIQIADACADAILDRFHLRPTSAGPYAQHRRAMYDIGQRLQQALGYKALFLMTGRIAEVRAMETAIEAAYETIHSLVQKVMDGR